MKKKYLLTTIILTIGLILVSCAKPKSVENDVIYFETSKIPLDPSSFIDSYRLIPLEITDNSIFRKVSKIKKNDSTYFIFDNSQNIIYLYNLEGKYKTKIDRRGNGPHEYVQIEDFTLLKDMIALVVYPRKIMFIDLKTMDVKEEVPLNKGYDEIIIENDNCYLYDNYSGTLDVYNIEQKEFKTICEHKPLKGLIPFEKSLYFHEGNIYLNAVGDDILYAIKDYNLEPIFQFDYTDRNNLHTFYSNRDIGPLQVTEILTHSLPNISNIIKIQNNLAFIYSFGLFQINMMNKSNERENYYISTALPMYSSIAFIESNKLTSWEYLFKLESLPETSMIPKEEIVKLKQTNDDKETIVLIEYTLK